MVQPCTQDVMGMIEHRLWVQAMIGLTHNTVSSIEEVDTCKR